MNNNEFLLKHRPNGRFVYNLGLEQSNLWRKDRTAKINYLTQTKELAEARQGFTWLKEGSSAVQQQALGDLVGSFGNLWNDRAHFLRPTWRKAGDKEEFYLRDLSVGKLSRKWGEILVPKAGWVRFRLSKPFSEIETSTPGRRGGVTHYVHPEIGFCEGGKGRRSTVNCKLPRMPSPLLIF